MKQHGYHQGACQKLNSGCALLEVPTGQTGGDDDEASRGKVLCPGRKTKMTVGTGKMTLKTNKGRGEKRFEEMALMQRSETKRKPVNSGKGH